MCYYVFVGFCAKGKGEEALIDIDELKEKLKSVKLLSEEQVTDIVNAVMNRLNPEEKPARQAHVYTDEPIDLSARPEGFNRAQDDDAAAERIAEMRKIPFKRENRGKTPEEIFFLQAKSMADFEDDYTPPYQDHNDLRRQELGRYFYGFQSMSVRNLRIYYTWRTKLRGGELLRTTLTNAFIYATELIHCIGFDSKEEAYEALKSFVEGYSALDSRFTNFGRKWLKDFAIFYDLPAELVAENGSSADVLRTLGEPFGADDEALYDAIRLSSSYKPENSRFCTAYPKDYMHVVCRVYRALIADDAEEAFRRYVGVYTENAYDLFGTAMFCARNCSADRVYRADGMTKYASKDGKWYVERLTRSTKQISELGRLLKNIDHMMRKRWKFASKIKADGLSESIAALIDEQITAYLAEKRIRKQQSIKLDLDKLPSIRSSADETAEMLLTEDEPEEETDAPFEKPMQAKPDEATIPDQTPEDNKEPEQSGLPELTEAEKALLVCLLNGEPYADKLRLLGVLPSIAADSLNEKMMDLFGDTVAVDNGEKLELIEDYIEDLKGIVEKL